jgi:hypothetical protein
MKKIILTLALLITASNLALGVVYAATCTGAGGSRLCGSVCAKVASGQCVCDGTCTKAEMDWVANGGSGGDEELEEANLF